MLGQKPKPRLLTVSPVLRFVNVTVTKFLILRKLVIEPSGSAMLPDGDDDLGGDRLPPRGAVRIDPEAFVARDRVDAEVQPDPVVSVLLDADPAHRAVQAKHG